MKREGHAFLLHLIEQQTISFYHNKSVTCFKRHYNVVKIVFSAHFQPFHDRFLHCKRCVAVKIGDAVSERSMVQSDPYCGSVFFTYHNKLSELFLSFFVILMEISRIDPDFLYNLCACYGYI